jgi:hypothetical protein
MLTQFYTVLGHTPPLDVVIVDEAQDFDKVTMENV